MSRRRSLGLVAMVLFVGCASPPSESPRSDAITREAYIEWRAANLLRAEPELRSFAEVVDTPAGEWPGHLQDRTIVFTALWLSIHDKKEGQVNQIDGRSVLVVLLGDPQRSDRNTRLCLDADDYAQDRFRYDNLASRSGEWRGTTVKVTAFMTGVPEDPDLTPWIGRVLAVEPSQGPESR